MQIASWPKNQAMQDVENDEYISLCNFGDRITRSFGVIEVGLLPPSPRPLLPGPRKQKEKKTTRSELG